jgi:hypothetical protein
MHVLMGRELRGRAVAQLSQELLIVPLHAALRVQLLHHPLATGVNSGKDP